MSSFPNVTGQTPGLAFVAQAQSFLLEVYLPKIRACIAQLSEEEIWWRPNDACNAIGNLVLHLAGNARQWIVAGVGGSADIRVRNEEFIARGGLTGEDLMMVLQKTLAQVDGVLGALSEEDLVRPIQVQGFETTVLQAVFHVVEHFSGHVGQITYLTKARVARGLGFYAIEEDGTVITNW
jgi:uncharacterized damage-inducible protein DinB